MVNNLKERALFIDPLLFVLFISFVDSVCLVCVLFLQMQIKFCFLGLFFFFFCHIEPDDLNFDSTYLLQFNDNKFKTD